MPRLGREAGLSAVVCLWLCSFCLGAGVGSSSGCLGWAMLLYCGTPWAFHVIIFSVNDQNKNVYLYIDIWTQGSVLPFLYMTIIFKDLLYKNRLANQTQKKRGALNFMGCGN